MRRISSTVHIDADPAEVWSHLAAFDRYHEWNPFLVHGDGEAVPGARVELRMRPPSGRTPSGRTPSDRAPSGRNVRETSFRVRVLDSDPGRLLRWRGRLLLPGIFDGVHTFELHPEHGGTRVEQYEVFSGALVPFTGTLLQGTRAGFTALTDALKTRAESTRLPR
ncbi:SRPBCC domain-containing protein [Streptomyces clavuligerus]|uniref:Cyclase/dehydrase n=1 Tax=Streptomyces clavuligerus TaxID=1901 RepID=E2Q9E4_STRCL|nr:SRPBCC domain-containing protein [Streptomyces clavuligerus]ANW21312.1 cyclase [Streptomyces clavuligerus]AXU15940.1 SRPBCC domain-containing protein [Streptomyces clavuligerus]EFG05564.1 Cyclase/dehydrase [Streptomyces clavuligerus]MBY6306067.1 SRPBCC domain-containing protein [Streptomyces clavuligerus]QCS08720.1 SRPBCC domain-containing protein [Streptomyces clavuligerus]